MNTLNKVSVSGDTRKSDTAVSSGEEDLNSANLFPVLSPTSLMHANDGRHLSRMSSSFKDVVKHSNEPQDPLTSDAVERVSPRISAMRQDDVSNQTVMGSFSAEAQSPVQNQVRAILPPVCALGQLPDSYLLCSVTGKLPETTHAAPVLQVTSYTDDNGFRTVQSRRTRSPKVTKDYQATAAPAATVCGISESTNPFAILAETTPSESNTLLKSFLSDASVAAPGESATITQDTSGSVTDNSTATPLSPAPLPELPSPPAASVDSLSMEDEAAQDDCDQSR